MAVSNTSSLNGFVKNSTASAFMVLHGDWARRAGGDEDDRHVGALNGDTLLQLEAIDARKRNIEHQADGYDHSWMGLGNLAQKRKSLAASLAHIRAIRNGDVIIRH